MVRLFLSKAGSQCCYRCIFHCLTFNVVSFCLILREILVLIHLELFVWNSLETQCIFTKPVPHRLVEPINTTAISVYNCCCTSPRNFITVVSHLSLPNSPHELKQRFRAAHSEQMLPHLLLLSNSSLPTVWETTTRLLSAQWIKFTPSRIPHQF